jgi:hypothetical protein
MVGWGSYPINKDFIYPISSEHLLKFQTICMNVLAIHPAGRVVKVMPSEIPCMMFKEVIARF